MQLRQSRLLEDKPGLGLLLFVYTQHHMALRNLAIKLANKLSEGEKTPVYFVPGTNGWPFQRLCKEPRLRLTPEGKLVTETGGLTLPQDRRIILLVECYDHLDPSDQRAYSHLVDGEGRDLALYQGSILIGGILLQDRGQLEPGSANRGMHLQLVS